MDIGQEVLYTRLESQPWRGIVEKQNNDGSSVVKWTTGPVSDQYSTFNADEMQQWFAPITKFVEVNRTPAAVIVKPNPVEIPQAPVERDSYAPEPDILLNPVRNTVDNNPKIPVMPVEPSFIPLPLTEPPEYMQGITMIDPDIAPVGYIAPIESPKSGKLPWIIGGVVLLALISTK